MPTSISSGIIETDTWTWEHEERWTTAPSQLQDFYIYWRNPTHIDDLPLSLSSIPPGELPPNIPSPLVRKSTVAKAYKDILENVYGFRQLRPHTGLVITGQPSDGMCPQLELCCSNKTHARLRFQTRVAWYGICFCSSSAKISPLSFVNKRTSTFSSAIPSTVRVI